MPYAFRRADLLPVLRRSALRMMDTRSQKISSKVINARSVQVYLFYGLMVPSWSLLPLYQDIIAEDGNEVLECVLCIMLVNCTGSLNIKDF